MKLFRRVGTVFTLLVLSGCGGGSTGDGNTGTVAETINVNIGGSVTAAGVLCDAWIEVMKLNGVVLYRTTSIEYNESEDTTEHNATARKLLPFSNLHAGKFTAQHTFAVDSVPADSTLMLVKVTGGHDIDPDGDGFVENGVDATFNGPLYAYTTFGDLKDGNVSINFFSSAAAAVEAERHLAVPSTIESILGHVSSKLFSSDPDGGAVEFASLTRFNPAVIENNTSAHFAYLNDGLAYKTLAASAYAAGLYEGNVSQWQRDDDNEGLFDGFERLIGSDTASADSDGDGVNDYAEVWAGTNPSDAGSVLSDPLYKYQWHLENSGQSSGALHGGTTGEDLQVAGALPRYAGSGNVVVALVDTGVESGHPDLENNLDISLSYNYATHTNDPIPISGGSGFHGTACAGIVGAQGYNGKGLRGVAPMTRLSGLNVFAGGWTTDFAEAFSKEGIDVFSNSWGPLTSASLTAWGSVLEGALEEAAVNGRNGKGAIFVFAAGNDRTASHEGYANTSSLHNSRYAITVSSVNAKGTLSSYSNTGANVLVAGTGGEYGFDDPAIVTTDLTGVEVGRDTYFDSEGNIIGDSSLNGDNPDGNYTRFMNGTSSACPSVAGVIALMLQANPALTRRDVRYILAHTARQNDPVDSGWDMNGAGLHVSDKYGFGVVDATAAVAMAEHFASLGPEQNHVWSESTDMRIPDANSTGIERSTVVAGDITVEHVDVWVTTEHLRIDDLRIVLISPAGTESVLAIGGEGYMLPTERYDHWRFSTVRCMDENAQGTWRLRVTDTKSGYSGSLSEWAIEILGH